MRRKHGPWTITETSRKYRNDFIEVVEDQVVKPDGEPGSYATVEMKAGVSVLALERDGTVYLTKQFRYALGRESVEAVSGAVDEGDPLRAARRELQEELGIEAAEFIPLGRIDMDTSILRCPVELFLARGLKFTESNQEGTETIEEVKIKLAEAVEMVMGSRITHSPSCAIILKANEYLRSEAGSDR